MRIELLTYSAYGQLSSEPCELSNSVLHFAKTRNMMLYNIWYSIEEYTAKIL